MNSIRQALSAFADRSPPRLRYLIGLSGGRDSVALLDLLHSADFSNLIVCHLNHGLRGRESGQDAVFARRLSKRYRVPFECEKSDIAQLASQLGRSLEDTGRRARLAFFARVSKKWRCRRVILAHHADDQIETILMNLGRGSGAGGLRGMRTESTIHADPDFGTFTKSKHKKVKTIPLTLLRPLLAVPRRDLESHITARALPYREDPSNTDPAHLRNRIRHQLLPALKNIFARDVQNAILRSATIGDEEDALLDNLAADALSASLFPDRADPQLPPFLSPALNISKLRGLHIALQRRVLHRWLSELGIPDISFHHIEAVRALTHPTSKTAKTNLPRDHHARRKSGRLFVTPPSV